VLLGNGLIQNSQHPHLTEVHWNLLIWMRAWAASETAIAGRVPMPCDQSRNLLKDLILLRLP
jgi:hypothetical protein